MIEERGRILFTRAELQCKCGCGRAEFTEEFLAKLKWLRLKWNQPMFVSSGYRCPAHNAKVSSSGLDGPHTFGAVDIRADGPTAYGLLKVALDADFTGIGMHQKGPHSMRFIHLDDIRPGDRHPRPWVWTY
jgi:zinc D-Ala-D-Ala carboxypeptidase